MRRDLVLVRCGRHSRHPTWLSSATDRAFDLWTCPYEDVPPSGDEPAVAPWPGGKWTGLAARLALDGRWRAYDRIWLPDDDLDATGEDLGRFFELCRRQDAALAQPALAEGSSASHLLTLGNRAFRARTTTFVEVMAPCFRRDVLERLLPTFAASPTGFGWGLDDAWARLLGYRGLFVFDEVTVGHFREVGAARSRAQRRAARAEMRRVRRRFHACSLRKTTAGLDASGAWIPETDPTFLARYEEGYRWYFASEPRARARLHRQQAMDPEAFLAAQARGPGWRRALRAFAGRPRARPPGPA